MNEAYFRALQATLLRRGVVVARDGKLSLDLSYSGADAPSQSQIDYLNEIREGRAVQSQIQLAWTADLVTTIQRLVTGTSTDSAALRVVLFLRLHGLFVDFTAHYRVAASIVQGATLPPTSDGASLRNVLESIDRMRETLSEDELLYLEYRRHVDAHIWQNSYDLQWNKKQAAAEVRFDSKVTRKNYNRRDLNSRISGVIQRYGDEHAIADDFAKRLESTAGQVLAAMYKFCSPSS